MRRLVTAHDLLQAIPNDQCETAIPLLTDGSVVAGTMGHNNTTTGPLLTIPQAAMLNACSERMGIGSSYNAPIQDVSDPRIWYSFRGTGSGVNATLCRTQTEMYGD